jgi:hypothetical protein
MSEEQSISHVSLQRAYQAAVQSLSELRSSEESVPRSLDEKLIKELLTLTFALQFEDDTSTLEKRVQEILEAQVGLTTYESDEV